MLPELLESNNSGNINPDLGGSGEATVVITFGILSAVGIFTNTTMIIILLRTKQTVFITIILGLSFSDLIASLISPFTIYQLLHWTHYELPAFTCGLANAADVATTIVTVQQVMLLTLIRYRSIIHAFDVQWEVTVKMCRVLVASSWLLSFTLLAIPFWIQTEIIPGENGLMCAMDPNPAMWKQVLSLISLSLGIIIPTIIIITLCIAIVRFLVKRRSATTVSQSPAAKEREDQVLLQLKAIVITFLVSYGVMCTTGTLLIILRYNIYGLVMFLLLLIPGGILRFTECVNPFLYYYASNDVRDEARRLKNDVGKLFMRSSTSPQPANAGEETATTSRTRSKGAKIPWVGTE